MSFKGNEGNPISRETAKSWMENYQQSESKLESGKSITKAHFFGKEGVLKLLNTTNCVGIRIYHGLDEKNNKQVFLTAVDSEMNDILPADRKSTSEEGAFILDESYPCPPYCPKDEI